MDTHQLTGMQLEDAEKKAALMSKIIRVVAKNGAQFAVTCDFMPNRIDVEVDSHGIITKVW